MTGMRERRRLARLGVPRTLGGLELELRQADLLDLSLSGARIEHQEHLHEGLVCFVDLSRAFGRLRLTGQVVWTRLHKGGADPGGRPAPVLPRRLAFSGLTPAQQSALAAALTTLQARGEAPDPAPRRGPAAAESWLAGGGLPGAAPRMNADATRA